MTAQNTKTARVNVTVQNANLERLERIKAMTGGEWGNAQVTNEALRLLEAVMAGLASGKGATLIAMSEGQIPTKVNLGDIAAILGDGAHKRKVA